MSVGDQFRQARLAEGCTVEVMVSVAADRPGWLALNEGMIRRVENDDPDTEVSVLEAYAEALGMDLTITLTPKRGA